MIVVKRGALLLVPTINTVKFRRLPPALKFLAHAWGAMVGSFYLTGGTLYGDNRRERHGYYFKPLWWCIVLNLYYDVALAILRWTRKRHTRLTTMRPVTSSSIKAIGYDPKAEALTIEFHSGARRQYAGVPAKEHAALIDADSIGKHFHANIRNNYESTRLDSDHE